MAKELVLIASDVRSAHNVGALFRTADGAGASKIYLAGYTPVPSTNKHFLTPAEKALRKTALGAEEHLAWEKREDLASLIRELKERGFTVYGLEQAAGSLDYRQPRVAGKAALVVGNEVNGLPGEILALCDFILEIPMRGTKNSLNVSVAAGIALYQLAGTME